MSKLKEDFGIRALFGTVIIVGFVFSIIVAMFFKPEVLEMIKDIYVPVVTIVLIFYFSLKAQK